MRQSEAAPLGHDIQGVVRLAFAALGGMTELVESMHGQIAARSNPLGGGGRAGGISSLVYQAIRGTAGRIGQGTDALLELAAPLIKMPQGEQRDLMIGGLNGVIGDYLHERGNPLALPMELRWPEGPVEGQDEHVLVVVHGLCLSAGSWSRPGHDHGLALSAEFGFRPAYLNYNTGRHISENGSALADMLEALVDPQRGVKRISLLGHSMGGLVSRSALARARQKGHRWPDLVQHLMMLGSPHHGAPLEKGGNWLDVLLGQSPYTAPLTRLGQSRSAGIMDLRFGYLMDEDWQSVHATHTCGRHKAPVPLPPGVRCFAAAASLSEKSHCVSHHLVGDGLVPVASALGLHDEEHHHLGFAEEDRLIVKQANHFDLLDHPEVVEGLHSWLHRDRQKRLR